MGKHSCCTGNQAKNLLRRLVAAIFVCVALISGAYHEAQAATSASLAVPASLAATASAKRVDLSWAYGSSGDISGFAVERSQSATSGFAKIATTSNSALSFSDQGLSDSQTYYYRARAFKQKGKNISYSSYSDIVSATTPAPATVAAPGSFELDLSGYRVGESDSKVDITIMRVGGSVGIATVDWRTSGITATYDQDYGSFGWTTLTFADGETVKTKSVSILSDTLVEGEETFEVKLGNPTGGATLGGTNAATVAILDDDAAPAPAPTPEPSPEPTPDPSLGYLPVFPGAQGFGTETKAGRGGQIIKVTNLNDSGSGSLRAAIAATGPRIIVFEVSGNIVLSDNLVINNPYVTIAGQTAPSPGITLKGAGFEVRSHDVLIQHLRVRVGDGSPGPAPLDRDGVAVYGPGGYNVVVDHVSVSWAVDKNLTMWNSGVKNVTISNSITSEALYNSIHPDGPHSMGLLMGDHAKNIAIIGTLFAHNNGRNPGIKGDTSTVVLNNLMYNGGNTKYGYLADDFGSGASYTSLVGNSYIKGPDTGSSNPAMIANSSISSGTKIYLADNAISSTVFSNKASFDPRVSTRPIWHASLIARSSSTVEASVLAKAGARPADRDPVDERIVNEVKSRTGSIIDSQQQVGGWPTLAKNTRAFAAPANPNGDDDGDGYTNIEEVLHQLAAQVEGR